MASRGITTLNELMGSKTPGAKEKGLTLEDLPKLLGEGMPKLEFHALGRVRLINALTNRFGTNYRSVPGISEVLGQFDKAADQEKQFHELKKKWGKK